MNAIVEQPNITEEKKQIYLKRVNPQTFFKVEADDWYWVEARINVQPQLIKPDQILQIITYVSDYEFFSRQKFFFKKLLPRNHCQR